MQATLAELKVEVNAAQQISHTAASQLSLGYKPVRPIQWELSEAALHAVSPRIAAGGQAEHESVSVLQLQALMRQMQGSIAAHTSQIASVQGS